MLESGTSRPSYPSPRSIQSSSTSSSSLASSIFGLAARRPALVSRHCCHHSGGWLCPDSLSIQRVRSLLYFPLSSSMMDSGIGGRRRSGFQLDWATTLGRVSVSYCWRGLGRKIPLFARTRLRCANCLPTSLRWVRRKVRAGLLGVIIVSWLLRRRMGRRWVRGMRCSSPCRQRPL